MKARCAWLTVSLLLAGVSVHAVTTNDLATAEREGRELARQLREASPATGFTNSGTLVVRASKKQHRTIRFNSRVVVTETNWTSFYDATDGTNDLSSFSVEHRPNAPSRYLLNHSNLLAAGQTAVAFAGSDFWLADLGLEFFHWPVQLLTQRGIKNGESYALLESRNSIPAPGGYSRVVSRIDNDTGGIMLARAYDARGKLLKEFKPTDFEKVSGEWLLKEMEMKNVQTGSRSTLIFDLKSP